MANLSRVLEDLLKNKSYYLKANKGEDFEDRIVNSLREKGFDRLIKEDDTVLNDYLKRIKDIILDPLGTNVISNGLVNRGPQYIDRFVYQPYGSQNFPDIIVFTKNFIIPIEDKFTSNSNSKPVWNSNLPKANAIYIFGSYGMQDLTFFRGNDVLPEDERLRLVEFFNTTKAIENEFKEVLKKEFMDKKLNFDRGFNVYVRKAFDQNQTINQNAELDYFKAKNREKCEKNVLLFLKELEEIK